MNPIAKVLIFVGFFFIVVGLIWQFGGRFFPLGRLPGDLLIKQGNFTFYFPVVTCILISVLLSLLFYLFRLFR